MLPHLMDQLTAYQMHQAGQFADAARIYQSLLDQNPNDAQVCHLFGVLHQQCGYPDRAAELIGRAIALSPETAAFHANLAEAFRSLKQYERAVASGWVALKLQPEYPEAANNLGLAYHDQGHYADAVAQFDRAIALRPDFAEVYNNRGTSQCALGNSDAALEDFRVAVRLNPNLSLARCNLGQALTDAGDPAEGLLHCQEAIRIQPDLPAAHNNLGNALRALTRWQAAREAYAEAIRLQPDLAVAYSSLGLTLQFDGQIDAGLPYFRRAVELAPDSVSALRLMATALHCAEEGAAAIPYCERRVQIEPDSPDAYCDLGWACHAAQLTHLAEAAYRRALELQPDHLDACLNLGALQAEQGALADAEATYRLAEVQHRDSSSPLARRALLVRGKLSDDDRDRLRFHLYGLLGSVPRMECLFALAQVADARGDFAEAAACLGPANELAEQHRRRLGLTYDRDEHSRYVDQLMAGFTPELFERLTDAGDSTSQPVFVFGMPRSGTTLVEQILSSHSQVHGAGELSLVRQAMDSFPLESQDPAIFLTSLRELDATRVQELAQAYRSCVQALLSRQGHGTSALRIVDKLPDNYLYLGLIALMFPKATLIHVQRDLRDVAVSCWQNQFRSIRWADVEENLARRCLDYQRLMQHWYSVLPCTIHNVSYEELVGNFEVESRRLLTACGLEWEPACRQFHQSARTVRTASFTQVRQPLYRSSLGRWKSYVPYLSTLFELLPDHVPDRNSSIFNA